MGHRVRAWLLAIGIASISATATAAEQKLRFVTFVPDRVVHVAKVIKPWAEEVARRSGGRLEIDLFTGGALGRGGLVQPQLVLAGIGDITWFPTAYVDGRYAETEIFDFPILSDDPADLTQAFWRLHAAGLMPSLDEFKVLAVSVSPPYNFHTAFPVVSLADVAARKLRVVNAAQAFIVRAMGATPVAGVSATQVAESMSRGLIEGAAFSWHATRSVGIELVSTDHIDQAVAFSPSVVVMNRSRYARLPADLKAVIDMTTGEGLSMQMTTVMLEEARAAIAHTKATGRHHFYTPAPDERSRLRAAFATLTDNWTDGNAQRRQLIEALGKVLRDIENESAHAGE